MSLPATPVIYPLSLHDALPILVAAPALTVIAGLVLAVLESSVMSVAVTVQLPAVLFVTDSDRLPETRAEFGDTPALLSVEVRPTMWVTLETTFQLASTPRTVTV